MPRDGQLTHPRRSSLEGNGRSPVGGPAGHLSFSADCHCVMRSPRGDARPHGWSSVSTLTVFLTTCPGESLSPETCVCPTQGYCRSHGSPVTQACRFTLLFHVPDLCLAPVTSDCVALCEGGQRQRVQLWPWSVTCFLEPQFSCL